MAADPYSDPSSVLSIGAGNRERNQMLAQNVTWAMMNARQFHGVHPQPQVPTS